MKEESNILSYTHLSNTLTFMSIQRKQVKSELFWLKSLNYKKKRSPHLSVHKYNCNTVNMIVFRS